MEKSNQNPSCPLCGRELDYFLDEAELDDPDQELEYHAGYYCPCGLRYLGPWKPTEESAKAAALAGVLRRYLTKEEREARHEREIKERIRQARETELKNLKVLPKLRTACQRDYEKWLIDWLLAGNRITIVYDMEFKEGRFKIAKEDVLSAPLYGLSAHNIIIPQQFKFLGGELGHNQIYYYENGAPAHAGDFVPLYNDILEKNQMPKQIMSEWWRKISMSWSERYKYGRAHGIFAAMCHKTTGQSQECPFPPMSVEEDGWLAGYNHVKETKS